MFHSVPFQIVHLYQFHTIGAFYFPIQRVWGPAVLLNLYFIQSNTQSNVRSGIKQPLAG